MLVLSVILLVLLIKLLIASFKTHCEETGVTEDFNFIDKENKRPSDVDMSNPAAHTSWISDPRCYTYGNILIDASTATIENLQQAHDKIRTSLHKIYFSVQSDQNAFSIQTTCIFSKPSGYLCSTTNHLDFCYRSYYVSV
jgi:hypothetical protein